jgi:hypothetical protein
MVSDHSLEAAATLALTCSAVSWGSSGAPAGLTITAVTAWSAPVQDLGDGGVAVTIDAERLARPLRRRRRGLRDRRSCGSRFGCEVCTAR